MQLVAPMRFLEGVKKMEGRGEGQAVSPSPLRFSETHRLQIRLLAVVGMAFSVATANSIALCDHRSAEKQQSAREMPKQTVEEIQAKYQDRWMSIPGVVGVGIGASNGKPLIKVLVIKKTLALERKIPQEAESYPVVIEETGEIRALPRKKKK